ncbi:MAG: DUF2461 domain-containing protein, partial [Cytophagales bacterium]|nr:DUF2461 domain-containing protein [Cytophagales bacterium]
MQFIFDFLKDLKDNNNREWFQSQKARYDKAKAEYLVFIGHVLK